MRGRPPRPSRLTLQARFTLVAAGAVAAVALAITAVAFLAIRTDLQDRVRQDVAGRGASTVHEAHRQYPDGHVPENWLPAHSNGFGPVYTQVITSAGALWSGSAGWLTPSRAAIGVAAGQALVMYDGDVVLGSATISAAARTADVPA